MSKYICSNLASDNRYTMWSKYDKNNNGLPVKGRSVLINGGSSVVNKRHLITPYGVVTAIKDEELELLKKNCPSFSRHLERGFLKVLDKDPSGKTKTISDDMADDKSAPLTPAQLKKEGKKAGKTGGQE